MRSILLIMYISHAQLVYKVIFTVAIYHFIFYGTLNAFMLSQTVHVILVIWFFVRYKIKSETITCT